MGRSSTASRSAADGARALAAGLLGLAALAGGACDGGEGTAGKTPAPVVAAYTRYATADAAIVTYCAGCHGKDGRHPDHDRAYQVLPLDRYEDWRSQTTVIAGVVDDAHTDGHVMPPPDAPAQPSPGERSMLLDWTRRGAPDTQDGR